MPRCYLIALATSSATDSTTNNLSLFHLVEQIQSQQFPVVLPLELHVYWEFEKNELGRDYEMRVLRVEGATATLAGPAIGLPSTWVRNRLRLVGLRLEGDGSFQLVPEWRSVPDGEWVSTGMGWPVQATVAEDPPIAGGAPAGE